MFSSSTPTPTSASAPAPAPAPASPPVDRAGALAALRVRLAGRLAEPGDADYDKATPWNRAISSQPIAVVAAESATDVATTVAIAREHGLRVAVRRTGHGAVPIGDDVVLVHTTALDELSVDPDRRVARVGAGRLWTDVVAVTAPHGLAPICGSAPGVGVVGYLSGGGLGPLARTYGISADHVRALDVVTGDGKVRHVTPNEHEDLFWGLRGGKATLGVVTAVEIDLVELTNFYGGSLWFAGSDADAVLPAWRDFAERLPEEGTTSVALLRLPPLPQLPPEIAGRSTVAVRFAWTGEPAAAERHLADLRRAARPVFEDLGVLPYSAIGRVHTDPVDPMPVRETSALLTALPDAAIGELVTAVGDASPHTIVELRALGGAVARPGAHPSAVSFRDAPYALFLSGVPMPDASELAAHAGQVLAAVGPWTHVGRLANFTTTPDPGAFEQCYDAATRDRLAALADEYDPEHVLHVGQVVRR